MEGKERKGKDDGRDGRFGGGGGRYGARRSFPFVPQGFGSRAQDDRVGGITLLGNRGFQGSIK